MALMLTMLAMAVPHAQEAEYKPRHKGCNTRACDRRVDRKIRRKRAHRYDRMRKRVTRPHRAWLRSTRMCESGGRYHIATGNGFYGAYQFTVRSWYVAGGHGMPHLNEPLEQDYRAVKLLGIQGRGAWPVCG